MQAVFLCLNFGALVLTNEDLYAIISIEYVYPRDKFAVAKGKIR